MCRFQKDCEWYYVFVDDQIPVKGSGKPVFGHCRDMDELWVPFVEKARVRALVREGGRERESRGALPPRDKTYL